MIYFYLGLSAIAMCVLHGISFDWFANNQDNQIHQITKLWLKDPIERAFLIDITQDCPEGTEEEQIDYNYNGTDDLCECQAVDVYTEKPKDRYLAKQNNNLQYCQQTNCQSGFEKNSVLDGISPQVLNTFFKTNNVIKKICVSRYHGYSFAKKGPVENDCDSDDEKYCIWNGNTNNNNQFDVDYGYCIPKDQICYSEGVKLPNYPLPKTQQLPIVGFQIDLYEQQQNQQYNLPFLFSIQEKVMLDINEIKYDPKQQQLLQQKQFQFMIQHMPRVKQRCRESLKNTLSQYIGADGAYRVSLALVVFSVFSSAQLFFFSGIGDIVDMTVGGKDGCISYCEQKRFNIKHTKLRNFCILTKPLLLIIVMILQLVIITRYVIIYNEFHNMVDDQCLDQYTAQIIGFNDLYTTYTYNSNLIYAALGLNLVSLIFDQNVYLVFKSFFKLVFCKYKLTKGQNNSVSQNVVQTSPENNQLKENENNKNDIEAQNIHLHTSPIGHNTEFAIKQASENTVQKDSQSQIQKKNTYNQIKLEPLNKCEVKQEKNKGIVDSKQIAMKELKKSKKKELNKKNKKKQSQNNLKNKKNFHKKTKLNIQSKSNNELENEDDYEDIFDGDIFNQIEQDKQNNQQNKNNEENKCVQDIQLNDQINQIDKKRDDNVDLEDELQIQFYKKKTEDFIQPPEAPAPPEQSVQDNKSIIDIFDDFD